MLEDEMESDKMCQRERNKEKRRIMKNILLSGVVIHLLCVAFRIPYRLQSTINREKGIGVITVGLNYGVSVLSCLFITKVFTSKVGHRKSFLTVAFTLGSWILANGYAVWATMIPGAVLLGLATGFIWVAQGSYSTLSAVRYAELTDTPVKAILFMFFGIAYAFRTSSNLVSSVLSSTILQTVPANVTIETNETVLATCGARDCPGTNKSNLNLERPPSYVIWILLGVSVGLCVIAACISMFLMDDAPKNPNADKEKEDWKNVFTSTIKLYRYNEAWLLFPLAFYQGMQPAFIASEFGKSYVACTQGIWMIGYVHVAYAIVGSVTSLASAKLLKSYSSSRLPVIFTVMLIDLGSQLALLFWRPRSDSLWILVVLSSLFGGTVGIWGTYVSAIYGAVFINNTDAAFSLNVKCVSLGSAFLYTCSYFLCVSTKTIILMVVLVLGVTGYFTVEILDKNKRKGQPREGGNTGIEECKLTEKTKSDMIIANKMDKEQDTVETEKMLEENMKD